MMIVVYIELATVPVDGLGSATALGKGNAVSDDNTQWPNLGALASVADTHPAGKVRLFKGFLKLVPSCVICGQ